MRCYTLGVDTIQRKDGKGAYTAEYRASVIAWVMADEGRTPGMGAEHFGVSGGTVRRWFRQAGTHGPGETISRESHEQKAAATASRSRTAGGRFRAPVADMGDSDRDRVVRTARDLAETVELGASMMLAQVKEARRLQARASGMAMEPEERAAIQAALRIDVKTAQAMLHLARTTGILVDTHPGLMKVAGIEEATEKGGRDLDAVARALGLAGPAGEAK